jgi:hypothetical protein
VKVNLHIDRIVIDGATLTRRERDLLAGTLAQEVARQLRDPGSPDGHDGRNGPHPHDRRGRDGAAPLGVRIAQQVVAALPVAALSGRRPTRILASGPRRPQAAGPRAAR